ncbi:GTPase-associated protein 1-related protein [Streptomyces sp. NPDC051569]|uniref:GTPase-associated protein 1-related protein n=1 Tax=Streptomyces sp. NPDC051569 TaxID=3365661 RepID=UPI003796404B
MSLIQLHGTSAPPGPDGPGVRFTAVTPGVAESLLAEAGQLIGYEPPHGSPPHPTAAELASFPQAFSHSVLSDGSRLVARAVATGAGPDGQGGAFHAHAVHLPFGAPLSAGAPPISAWGSPLWAAATPAGGIPTPLEALPASGSIDRRGLVGFAAARAPWLALFFGALRETAGHVSAGHEATGEGPAPRIVLVERDSADVARWIALASAVLPLEDAHRLTFTTYTRQPRLARQRIIGVLPNDARDLPGNDRRYRVLDATGRPPAMPEGGLSGAWAEIAAAIWLDRAPELFQEATALPGGPFAPGPLAVVMLCAGIAPSATVRTEAALWAAEHAQALDGTRLHRLVEALCAPAEGRTATETAALTRLFAALADSAPAATSTPLGSLVLTSAVRLPDPGPLLPELRSLTLPPDLQRHLAAELAPVLRASTDAHTSTDTGPGPEPDVARPAGLLRVADLLGVDCTDLLPGIAHRLASSLLAAPEASYTPAVRAMLEDHFELRTALLSHLDALAAADPPAAVRLLSSTSLALTGAQSLPHLRMCAGAPWLPAAGGDHLGALHTALRACGVSSLADPLVLRTGLRLVWDGALPSAAEARLLLTGTGSDTHRAAGTWTALVAAALEGPADDPDAPDLAHDLLRCFPDELDARGRGALVLLAFARDLREGGRTAPPWTARALSLRAAAEPVAPGVLGQVFGALSLLLLSEERPEGELYALVHSGDADLVAAYAAAARQERVRDRLRTVPAYVAHCFGSWTALPGANRTWDKTRAALLDTVLRPVVRALSAEEVAAVERILAGTGGHRAEEFRTWNRPGALSRLGRRFGGRRS